MKPNGRVAKAQRQAQDRTVTGIAKAIGIGQPHLSNIENEDRPCTAAVVVRLAKELKISVALLQRNRDYPDPELVDFLVQTDDLESLIDVLGYQQAKALMSTKAVAVA